jgi:chemosensory pili system protein ChpA (sensor histidine kinase/response regulator)
MTESREHFALDWIKREIDETLKAARQALEAYAESNRDETRMRACLTYLHQVHGTLLMLELTGVTVLTDEMEQLAQGLLAGSIKNVDDAQQLLMQGILQLPAFLEEIQKGYPDSRRAVLPLANELREARGVERFPEAHSRGTAAMHLAATDETLKRFDQIDGTEKARRIRAAYQQVLLSVLKGHDSHKALATLGKVAVGLERICERTPYSSLWRAFSAFVAALADSGAELTGDVVRLLRRVDAEIKALAQDGAAALTRPLSLDLVKQLADAAREYGNESADIKQLGDSIEQEPAEERVAISKREAIHTAAAALREELASVKDALDLFVRSEQRSTDSLLQLAAPLKQIGSTLSILGFESSRAVIADQVESIHTAVQGGACDDALLLGVASALLQVDENLAAIAQQRGSFAGTSEAAGVIGEAQVAVLGEARTGLEQVKQAIVDYVSAQWDTNRIADVPALLSAVRGALAMVPLARPADQLDRCARYVANELIAGNTPDWAALDAFADAISGIDYYLERLCDDAAHPGDDILNVVDRSLTQLGYGQGSERALRPLAMPAIVEPDDAIEAQLPQVVAEHSVAQAATPVGQVSIQAPAIAAAAIGTRTQEEEAPLQQYEPPEEEQLEEEIVVVDVAAEPEAQIRVGDARDSAHEVTVQAPSPAAKRQAPTAEFDLVIEDPDEVSTGPVSVEELDDEAFDLSAGLFDEEAPNVRTEASEPILAEAHQPPLAEAPKPLQRDAMPAAAVDFNDEDLRTIAADEPSSAGEVEVLAASATTQRQIADAPADVDDDILEIFVEEVGEVLERVDQWLPQWADEFANEEALAEVRRAFHTLKGSGRIVGANVIGELAWSVENMLNRVMDGTLEPNRQIAAVVNEARVAVPALCQAFESRRPVSDSHVALIMEKADVLASGGRLEELAEERHVEAKVVPLRTAPTVEEIEVDQLPEPTAMQTAEQAEDAETFALFEQEAAMHLAVLEERFLRADEPGADALGDDAIRALHTLRGSASMAGVDSVARVAGPLYQVVREARDRGARIGSDIIDFVQQGVFALRRTLNSLTEGTDPHEDLASFEAEADRIVAGLGEAGAGASALLSLDGAPVLLAANDFLAGWRSGAMDLGALSDTVAALHELRNEAESQSQTRVTSLCDALISAYERLEDHPLNDAAYGALNQAHECLLGMFDAIAAEQALPDPTAAMAALAKAHVAEVVEEELDLSEPEDRIPRSAKVVDFPTFVRPQPEPPAESFDLDDLSPAVNAQIAAGIEASRETPHAEAPEMPAAAEPQPEVPLLKERVESTVAPSTLRPTVTLPPDADREILEIFFEEAEELLEAIDHGIHEWLETPDNRIYLENLLRALHTLKGGARLAGLSALGDDAHAFESFLIGVQGKPSLPAGYFDALQLRHDDMVSAVGALKDAASGESAETAAPPPVPVKATATTPVQESGPRPAAPPRAAPTPLKPVAPAPPRAQTPMVASEPAEGPAVDVDRDDETGRGRAAQEPREMVRVSAGLLEQLVNLAGESSIIRSRVEQGMNDFSTSLEEMEITIERVREQLRRLEIETETQVLFRHEVSRGQDYEEFDPLEMDRYSQLQQLSRSLSESASDMLDLKETLAFKARESETLLIQQARVNTELQEGLMRTRMVPFNRLLPRLRRTVRQVSRELGKEVDLHVYNAEGELDRNVLERMVPPLEHMLRNAVDHGIERAEFRRGYGKPDVGRIDLRLSREAGDVVIEISDDGAGIDVESVRAKALERGLMAADANLRDDEILQFVFAPGFSTAKLVTQISGRGVGMDVVHSAVKQLGGSITIMSMPGKGTRFTVRLPFTVSVNRALMVSVGEDQYAIPLNTIEGIVRVSGAELERLYRPDGGGFEYAGVPYRVRYLGSFIGRDYVALSDRGSVPVVLVRSGDRAVAVHVDGVQGSREIVVKSLGPQFAGVGGISGATILGDGSVVVILDLLALIRAQTAPIYANGTPAPAVDRPTCVMVVDDSVTVRKVTSRLLERQGMDVILAKDGVEAVAMLQERRPDIMLLDIEMPRMDGFEVARQIRHDERLADLPIVMISSRTGSKHQERAEELGVNRFLGKPFQENELLATIEELVH